MDTTACELIRCVLCRGVVKIVDGMHGMIVYRGGQYQYFAVQLLSRTNIRIIMIIAHSTAVMKNTKHVMTRSMVMSLKVSVIIMIIAQSLPISIIVSHLNVDHCQYNNHNCYDNCSPSLVAYIHVVHYFVMAFICKKFFCVILKCINNVLLGLILPFGNFMVEK